MPRTLSSPRLVIPSAGDGLTSTAMIGGRERIVDGIVVAVRIVKGATFPYRVTWVHSFEGASGKVQAYQAQAQINNLGQDLHGRIHDYRPLPRKTQVDVRVDGNTLDSAVELVGVESISDDEYRLSRAQARHVVEAWKRSAHSAEDDRRAYIYAEFGAFVLASSRRDKLEQFQWPSVRGDHGEDMYSSAAIPAELDLLVFAA